MDRRTRHIVVIGIAVLTAGLASFGVYRAITNLPVREVEVASRYVVVAKHELPPGVRISKDDVRLAAWPNSSPVSGSYASIDEVVNRALLATVVENEPLLASKLANRDAGAGLPPAIPPGMRAIGVRVNEVIGVAGFLDPGTRVDLVVTIRNENETTSRTVVSNVQVLTAGTRGEQEKARTSSRTSLLTTPANAVVTLLVARAPQPARYSANRDNRHSHSGAAWRGSSASGRGRGAARQRT
jgi:pilus assembly protein CpaB